MDRRRFVAPFARQTPAVADGQALLTNQTFRDIYQADTLDVDQRLKITSLTFLFTDLKYSTVLYERVGDLVAYGLVRQHFHVLYDVVAAEAGAVVKTVGDVVMTTFPTPDRALTAALRMRKEMARINSERNDEDLIDKSVFMMDLASPQRSTQATAWPDREAGRPRAGAQLPARSSSPSVLDDGAPVRRFSGRRGCHRLTNCS